MTSFAGSDAALRAPTDQAGKTVTPLQWRDAVRPEDSAAVHAMVVSTGFFNKAEVDVAVELVDERLRRGLDSGYHFLFAEQSATAVAYACFGPVPATTKSFDLYWIVVHQDWRGHGIGRQLLAQSEARMADLGAGIVWVETSSRPQYEPTRAFYLRCGYQIAAQLTDFYAPGDGKVILRRDLPAPR